MPFRTRTTLAAVATALGVMACSEATAPTASLEPGAPLSAKGPKDPKDPKDPKAPKDSQGPKDPKGGGNDDAGSGSGQKKVTICHVGDGGLYVMLTVGAPGAANHLAKHKGDVVATLRNGSYGCATRPGQ